MSQTASPISTISEFLLQAGTDYRVFDMGRSIRPISSQAFLDIEHVIAAAPYPRLQQTWWGLVFWNKQLSDQHYIWFIKLPVDEQGMLIPAARNHFLQIIVEALGKQLEHAEANQGQLPDNPYSFAPGQQQLADFNSISRVALKLGPSGYFDVALDYLRAPHAHNWQRVSVQGLADLAAQIGKQALTETFCAQFLHCAQQVQFALALSLENQPVSERPAGVLQSWLQAHPDEPEIWQHGLRALGQSPCTRIVQTLLNECLNSPLGRDINLLTIITGRLWQHLSDPQLLRLYLEQVAIADQQQDIFAPVYTDLVRLPQLRPSMLEMLRWPDKSPALTQAVGKVFSGQYQ